jgi:hypothetical protein
MNGLHPIIRRKRRPLFVAESVPMAVPPVPPVQPVVAKKLVEAMPVRPAKTKSSDAKTAAITSAP